MKPEYDLPKLKSRKNPYASKLKKPGAECKLGALKGQIWIAPDFDETPQDVIDSFWNSKLFPDEDKYFPHSLVEYRMVKNHQSFSKGQETKRNYVFNLTSSPYCSRAILWRFSLAA